MQVFIRFIMGVIPANRSNSIKVGLSDRLVDSVLGLRPGARARFSWVGDRMAKKPPKK